MAIKTYKPTTPSRRHMTVSAFEGIDKKAKPERKLTEVLKKNAGRNSYGRITVRHHGGGNRVKYRVIDFKRNKFDVPATVKTLEYDPNRSAFIALVEYEDGAKSYILAPDGLKVGDTIMAGPNADIKPGNAMALAVGTIIGAAFSTITKSLTDDIIMPIVSIFMGGIDFSEMKIVLPRLFGEPVLDDAGNVVLNTLNYGNFISAVINFLILALVVFFLVKSLNKLTELGKKKEEAAPAEPPKPSNEELLLTEIRDLLKEQK